MPGSLRAAAVMFSREPFWAPYAQIRHSVLTGEPGVDQVYGMSIYEFLSRHPEEAGVFGAAAAGFHAQAIAEIAAAHDFSRYGTVVDVGGGTGTLLAAVLQRYPTVRGVLFDRPEVIEQARATFDKAELTGRVDLVGGDFFESVPHGDALLICSCSPAAPTATSARADLLAAGGFAVRRRTPCGDRFSLIEAAVSPLRSEVSDDAPEFG